MPQYSPPPCRGVLVLRTGSPWRLRFLLGVLAQDRRCAQYGWRGRARKPHPRFARRQERRRQGRRSGSKQIGKRRNRLRVSPLRHPLCPHQVLFDACLVDPSNYSFKREWTDDLGRIPVVPFDVLGTPPRNPVDVPDNALAVHDGLGGLELAGLGVGGLGVGGGLAMFGHQPETLGQKLHAACLVDEVERTALESEFLVRQLGVARQEHHRQVNAVPAQFRQQVDA